MQLFTPEQYMKIELANLCGKDKLDYLDRIDWVDTYFNPTEVPKDESPNQARVAYQELLKVQQGELSNYCVSLDATASVLQLISVLTNCHKTAHISNVVGNHRNDPYTIIHAATKLPSVPRKECKEAIMTMCYGSEEIPKRVYGDSLDVFFNAMAQEAPASIDYVDFTQSLWNPTKLVHTWTMPDNFNVILPSTTTVKETVTLLGKPITVQYEVEGTKKKSKELSANIIHS